MFRSALRLAAGRARPKGGIIALAPRNPGLPGRPMLTRGITSVQPVPKRRRWPLVLLGLTAVGAYGYWKWLTHHNFPPTVATLLKEGLWATINGAGYRKPDYKQALGKYIEALQEADRLEMIPWSDEYTGIQMIIADLYERLHLFEEAALMYAEIANTYLIALSDGSIPKEFRDKIITRDLRVVLIAALLTSTDANSFRSVAAMMTPHMILATREAAKQSEELQFLLHQQPLFDMSYLRDMQTKQLPTTLLEGCWGSYRTELFAMREIMTGMAAAKGQYMEALMLKLKTTQLMLTSGFSAGECLLSAANIASLMYLQSVNMKLMRPELDTAKEGASATATAKPATAQAVQASQAAPAAQTAEDESTDLESEDDDAKPFSEKKLDKLPQRQAMASLIRRPPPPPRPTEQPTAQAFADLANTVYGEIIETVGELDQRRTDFIPEAYVMALYGQGVIAASRGDWALAADRLGEARLRAKGSEIEQLVQSADEEIVKVERLKQMTAEEIRDIKVTELPMVDVMFWKLTPDVEDLERPELPEPRL